jgi:hypothetical protein
MASSDEQQHGDYKQSFNCRMTQHRSWPLHFILALVFFDTQPDLYYKGILLAEFLD